MNKIITITLMTIFCVIVTWSQDTMLPLIREGVVWHYAYYDVSEAEETDFDNVIIRDFKVQFRGDTLINGLTYKKCFFYDTESLEDNELPISFAREENGKVMFLEPNAVEGGDFFYDWSLPGEFNEQTGERVVYDFNDVESFVTEVYGNVDIEKAKTVVGGFCVPNYTINEGKEYVMGVGIDGPLSGYLFMPGTIHPTCWCSYPMGLIKLTDLEGNLLYKGYHYDIAPNPSSYDLTHDGKVDIEDVNAVINAMLGK
ncbi:MAG: hypothetical protein IJ724_10990 [Muribaculaceae bacterium]|nr:hypothetical protein [Muribaculaceae bacterium]